MWSVISEGSITYFGSPVLNGKEPYHKGHKVHKGEKSLVVGFRFVTVVSFVFEKWHPVKNGRALICTTKGTQYTKDLRANRGFDMGFALLAHQNNPLK
jgi:hypothetical protein